MLYVWLTYAYYLPYGLMKPAPAFVQEIAIPNLLVILAHLACAKVHPVRWVFVWH